MISVDTLEIGQKVRRIDGAHLGRVLTVAQSAGEKYAANEDGDFVLNFMMPEYWELFVEEEKPQKTALLIEDAAERISTLSGAVSVLSNTLPFLAEDARVEAEIAINRTLALITDLANNELLALEEGGK